jgi:hypothetical protein
LAFLEKKERRINALSYGAGNRRRTSSNEMREINVDVFAMLALAVARAVRSLGARR